MDGGCLGCLVDSRLGCSWLAETGVGGGVRAACLSGAGQLTATGRSVFRTIDLTTGDGQPLPCCRNFFLAFFKFGLQLGDLIGVSVQLFASFGKLSFLTSDDLIRRLKLFLVGLRCQRRAITLPISAGIKGEQSHNRHSGAGQMNFARDREFLLAIQAGARLRQRFVALEPLWRMRPIKARPCNNDNSPHLPRYYWRTLDKAASAQWIFRS